MSWRMHRKLVCAGCGREWVQLERGGEWRDESNNNKRDGQPKACAECGGAFERVNCGPTRIPIGRGDLGGHIDATISIDALAYRIKHGEWEYKAWEDDEWDAALDGEE